MRFVDFYLTESNSMIRLYRGMSKKFNPNHDLSNTDALNGYSTWTDNIELAKQYAGKNGYVYQIDLPKKEMGEELIDNDGERSLFVNNKKPAGLNNISGDEYLVYTAHDLYNSNDIKLVNEKTLILYHGTKPNKVNNIKRYGLKSPTGYDSASWYMLSSDFESALFHAYSDDNKSFVYVIEFEIPVTNEKWNGYPYLWPEQQMKDSSSWYALKQKIPQTFIKTIHKVPYEKWIEQKSKGF